MKKTILTALAALLVAVPAVQAQKVNKEALLSKIEKSDADIANPKKQTKAATWINRGKAFYDAAAAPTANLFVGMDATMLELAEGKPEATGEETLLDKTYTAWTYPYYTVYIKDGKVAAWKQTQWVMKDAAAKAIEAYAKAGELDPKSAPKVKEGLKQVSDLCSQAGNVGLDTGDYAAAAEAYATAYDAQSVPAFGQADPALLYYAGYLLAVDGAKNPASFPKGAEYLNKALDKGYADEEGNLYYYLFHCYYGQREADHENIMRAKEALLAGIQKFPKNQNILDGLMQLYTSEKGVGDPADLVSLIDNAIKESPDNVDLWFGRGRIFYALKNTDESIASFQKVVDLRPDMFEGNYYLGIFYTIKADDMIKEMNEKQYSSQAEYDKDLKAVNEVYLIALPWFEKAHEINPEDVNTLDMLKSVTFRLRDEAGMQEKYETYNELYKKAKGEA